MSKKIVTRIALSLSLMGLSAVSLPYGNNHNGNISAATITLPEVTITAKAIKARKISTKKVFIKEYLGFGIEGKIDTAVTSSIKNALSTYTGPKTSITSMKRHWGNKSAHEHGEAVDLKFDKRLIEWLVTVEGKAWLKAHSLMFYIEGRPGSKALKPYKKDLKYKSFVLENPRAVGKTGDHIHIELI